MNVSSPRLTVAQLDSEMGFSGGEVQVFLLMEGLRERGCHVVLFCQPGSESEREAVKRGFEVERVPMRNYLDVAAIWRLRRAFARHGVDVVHANTGRDSWLGGWAAHRAGLPAVTTRRMDREVKPGWRTRLIYETFFDRVGAISPGVVECLRAGGVPESNIALIPEAADPVRTTPTTNRNEVRAALGIRDKDVLALGMGALVRRKGFDVLLTALSNLDAALLTQVQVCIGGSGADQKSLEAQAQALGLSDRVRFLGRRNDVGDLLGASDFFVIPSRREGLGVAALEAMAAGRAVIASRVGGLAFSIVEGKTGLLVPPEDPQALSQALGTLIADGGLRTRLGAGARRRVEERFLPDRMVDTYLALYRTITA